MRKTPTTMLVLNARLDVLTVALQEVLRALAQAQAHQVADGIRSRVAGLAGESMAPAVDEARTADLVQLLAVLEGPGR